LIDVTSTGEGPRRITAGGRDTAMDDELIRRIDDRRIDELLGRSDAELRACLEPGRVGRLLAWAATRPDEELEELGFVPTEDERFELVAWALTLQRLQRLRP
jgi:hypothetical protein